MRRLFRKYRSDPRRVLFDFAEVRRSIAKNIKAKEYPEDSPLTILQSTLTIGINEVLTVEPDLQVELERSFPKATQEPPSQDDMLVLTDAMSVLPELAQNLLERQLGEDIIEVLYGEVVDYESLPDAGSYRSATTAARLSVRRRLASRVARLYSKIRVTTLEHYDSDTFKRVRVVGTYAGFLGFLAAALQVVSRLLL